MLTVRLPPGADAARRYAVDTLLGEFLGLAYCYGEPAAPGAVRIEAAGQTLTLAEVFFPAATARWLEPASLPADTASDWHYGVELPEVALPEPTVPCRFVAAAAGPMLRFDEHSVHCRLDIPGTVFFLLTRYEEAVATARDGHGRVPLAALSRFQRAHLHRPLVDEYVELLFALLQRLWPQLVRRPRSFRLLPSHDVDRPFEYLFMPPARLALRVAADLLQRRAPALALAHARSWWRVRHGDLAADPCNTFDWLMSQSEQRNLQSAFYFICARPGGAIDGDYELEHPAIRALLVDIARRGHEIGVHGSYRSGSDAGQLGRELGRLRALCAAEGITRPVTGGRQHFLRWDAPATIVNWEQAGLVYDSTLTFAEQPGFRCGTCHEHHGYDLRGQRALGVRERPLIVMECSVIDDAYLGLGDGEAARAAMVALKQTCRRFAGDFTLLWHNSRLATARQRQLYMDVLDA